VLVTGNINLTLGLGAFSNGTMNSTALVNSRAHIPISIVDKTKKVVAAPDKCQSVAMSEWGKSLACAKGDTDSPA
jgi:hypothetical protein